MNCPNCRAPLSDSSVAQCPICRQDQDVPQTAAAARPSNSPSLTYRRYQRKKAEKAGKPLVGWLIRNQQDKPLLCYPIYEGINTIGRPSASSRPDLPIDDDEYVSRMHGMCRVTRSSSAWECTISDDGYPADRPSVNGIYLNGNPDRVLPHQSVALADGDTVQIGMTKLVYKAIEMVTSEAEAVARAVKLPPVPTIIYKT